MQTKPMSVIQSLTNSKIRRNVSFSQDTKEGVKLDDSNEVKDLPMAKISER
jgi:hypothetical protein